MKKIVSFFLLALAIMTSCQEKKIKNVIILIPDGTSLASVSTARWYQRYTNPDKTKLNIDPYLCGTILTYCSNAPIGDSAPTTSCYMTGYPSLVDWVSTYPVAHPETDIVPIDSTKAYQPLMTVLEAARIMQNKATGLVFTCEFPHATPADCSAHSYSRSKYEWIAPQMVHNGLDVVIGGGVSILRDEDKQYLQGEGCGVFLNQIDSFRTYQGNKMWALFKDKDMSYDIDRDTTTEPSLAEMTEVAISKLSKNKNGFFLMVEGSKIDWAAHSNDPRAIISDMLAFDKACGVALDFAKKDGNTLVIVVPDHGNSGISIGCTRCPDYALLSQDQLFKTVSQYKTSFDGLINILHKTKPDSIRSKVLELTGITLTDEQYKEMLKCGDYNLSKLTDAQRMKGTRLKEKIGEILVDSTCFGFTTHGHTGEEVFLAVYDPTSNRMTGHHTNIELNHYMRESMQLPISLEALTNEYFAKHTDVFGQYNYELVEKKIEDTVKVEYKEEKYDVTLQITNGAKQLIVKPYTNIVNLNGQDIKLNSVIVYVDKNKTFYLPHSLGKMLENKQ
ncbi:MAG: alkaline phosphatase [Dysgonamonadaceae bacterium]|jgi:alkaline phosphatase|nr:alkaline phosphatase [Dysgonamonadaceae bacterium]